MRRDLIRLTISLLAILTFVPLMAQTDKVEQQRARIQALEREISKGETQVENLRKSKTQKEQQIRKLGSQIEQRNQLLKAQENQIKLLNNSILQHDKNLSELTKTLESQRAEYASMVRSSYRSYSQNSIMTYIFTSEDFIDMSRRLINLREVAKVRKERIERTRALTNDIEQKRNELEANRKELAATVRNINVQRSKIQRDINVARENVRTMSNKEREAMQKNQMNQKQLDSAVATLRKLVQGNAEGASFNAKVRKLTLPVSGGRVKRYIENLMEVSGGEGARVTSIYEGKVVEIKQNRITGNYDLYVAHGEYITSYAGLSQVSVKKNQRVSRNQSIGVVGMALDLTTMQSEYKIVFGIYAPDAKTKLRASSFF